MGSGASILDHSHIKASTNHKPEKTNSKTDTKILIQEDESQASTSSEVGELQHATSEKFSIFEEPVVDSDITDTEKKNEKAERRLSRNIVSGEVQGNVLQAQFSMKSLSPAFQHNEYLLQKTSSTEAEGDKLHATKLADLRKNMREKLSNELSPPLRTVSCIEGIGLPALQDLKSSPNNNYNNINNGRKNTLDTIASMPNMLHHHQFNSLSNINNNGINNINNINNNGGNNTSLSLAPIPPIGKAFDKTVVLHS